MISGEKLANVGFQYLGVSYKTMDCQAFVERCLRDCGLSMDLAGSNAWYREVMRNGWVGTPEECVQLYGCVPAGAFLFILKQDGKEPAKYKPDGIGNASHIGICTGSRGEGAIHSSSSRGCVCESKFKGKTIPNGGWNRVGLWDRVDYTEANTLPDPPEETLPTLRRKDKGPYVTLLQTMLAQKGYNLGSAGIDGDYGQATERAVMDFQRDAGLTADGICGPRTWEALQAQEIRTYCVIIHEMTRSQAEELKAKYGNAEIREE